MQGAFSLGALGYVVKAHAGSDLLIAMEAVLQGKQSLSTGLSARHFTEATDGQAPKHLHLDEVLTSPPEAGD